MKQTLKQSDVSQHTLGYSSSAKLCGPALNSSDEKEQCAELINCFNPPKGNLQDEAPEQAPIVCYKASSADVVCVRGMDGEILDPTYPRKARKLLKEGSARVVCRKPFTIQLNHRTTHYLAKKEVKIDTGSSVVGISICTSRRELFSAELELRTHKIVKNISTKKMYRHHRRYCNTRYRKPRFLNRKKGKGWLPPSTQHGINAYIRLLNMIGKYIPVQNQKAIIEIAKFDIQKINNPTIEGKEYQEGPQLGYQNVRAYVLDRDNYTCVGCKATCFGKNKTKKIQVHHIESRQTGGDSPSNLICLCDDCHKKLHNGKLNIELLKKEVTKNNKKNRADTFMSILRKRLPDMLRALGFVVEETFGYITKHNRIALGLEKSHMNDAFAMGDYHPTVRCKTYHMKEKRRNNRCLQNNAKGRKPSIRRKRYDLQPDDVVRYNNKLWEVSRTHSCGKSVILKNGDKIIDISPKKIEIIKYNRSIYIKEFN